MTLFVSKNPETLTTTLDGAAYIKDTRGEGGHLISN